MEQEKKIIQLILSNQKTDRNKAMVCLLGYETKVRKFLYSQLKTLPSYLEFEDIFYDAIVIFMQTVKSDIFVLKNKNGIVNYITRICKNKISKAIKSEQREKEFHKNDLKEFMDINSFDISTKKQKKGIKELILSINISPGCEKVILCYFLNKMSHKEIAEELNLKNANSSKTKLSVCIKKLKTLFNNNIDLF